jgi:hypothetical protein
VRLILDADTMTVQQVRDEVMRLKGLTGPDSIVVRSCSITKSTWDNVIKPAYELARKNLGSKGRDEEGNATEYSDGVCLEVICASFLADPNNQPEIEIPYERKMEGSRKLPALPSE